MQRCHLECIQDFSLDNVKVMLHINHDRQEGVGGFKVDVSGQVELKPISYVYDYIVRTLLAKHLEQNWLTVARKEAMKQAVKHGREMYEDGDFKEDVDDKKNDRDKVWAFTKLKKEHVYEFFCKATEAEAKKPEKKDISGYYPDLFQPVMATERLLSEMYMEAGLQSILRAAYESKEKEALYKSVFGNFEDALVSAPFLENTFTRLPVGIHMGKSGGIPVKQLRRVLSPNFASVAAFFAFACYDETSLNRAYALLQKKMDCGDKIKDEKKLFSEDLVVLFPENRENYLFNVTTMDDGAKFVKNVVDPLNRLAYCLSKHATYRSAKKGENILMSRLQSHLFRTMCSDMVEIYVSHGCYPLAERSIFNSHPGLNIMIKHHHEEKKDTDPDRLMPVPLLLEYIMNLIAESYVLVRTSHCFRVNPTALHPFEDVATKGKTRVVHARPKTTEIRYLYHCFPLKVGLKDVYMTLPELVNVILFRMQCPWDSDDVGQLKREWPAPMTQITLPNPEQLWDTPVKNVQGKDTVSVGGSAKTKKKSSRSGKGKRAGGPAKSTTKTVKTTKRVKAKKIIRNRSAKKRKEVEKEKDLEDAAAATDEESDKDDDEDEDEEKEEDAEDAGADEESDKDDDERKGEESDEDDDESENDVGKEQEKEDTALFDDSDDDEPENELEKEQENEDTGVGEKSHVDQDETESEEEEDKDEEGESATEAGEEATGKSATEAGEEATGMEAENIELKNRLKTAQKERDLAYDENSFLKDANEYVELLLEDAKKKAEKAERDKTEAEQHSALQAERILALEAEILSINAGDTGEVASTQQAHDKFVEACSLLLDQMQVGVGSVAVKSHHPAWESVSNMSKIMTTLSELQLSLLAEGKSLSVPNEAGLTSHHKMKLVMLDFQRVLYSRASKEERRVRFGHVKNRIVRGDRGEGLGDSCLDCVEWMERLIDRGSLASLKATFEKKDRDSGYFKVVEAGVGGVGGSTIDGSIATSEFPGRLNGLKDGLVVPWVTEPDEKPTATTRKAESSGVDEQNPTDVERKSDSPGVGEEPQKAESSGVDEDLPAVVKRKADPLEVGEEPNKKQKVAAEPESPTQKKEKTTQGATRRSLRKEGKE